MLIVTDIYGNSEPLVTVRGLTRERKLSGDETLSFVALSTEAEQESFSLLQGQSLIEFGGVEYVIKESTEKSVGTGSLKEVSTVRKFFEDLSRKYYYETTSGTKTISQLMSIVTNGTNYTFTVVDSFASQIFENFGKDNHLALFQTVLTRYGAEFEIIGTLIVLKQQVGIDSDFQFRYGYNVKNASVKQSTYGFTTYVKGFGQPIKDSEGNETGQYVVEGEYYSPLASIPGIGIIEADPVYDERVTDQATLNAMMQAAVQDNPIETIELDFVDLRAAGYPYDVPNLGDRVFVIYEPLSNLNIETRITEVSEEFDFRLDPNKPIATKVTLASINRDITDTLASFSGTSKTVDKAINKDGSLTNDVLPQAVKDATQAVESAQTEVLFDRGIRLIDKDNPLLRVVLTAAGVGISFDGGVTYETALTGNGIVADVLTSGSLNTNNVKIEGDTNFYWDGEYLIAQDPLDANKYVRFSKNGLEVTTNGGTSFETAIDANGVVADSIRSTGSIDVETIARVGTELIIGQDWQDSTVKRIRFNGDGGAATINFNPATDQISMGALNGLIFNETRFTDNTYRQGVEVGICGVGGIEATQTTTAIAGVYVQFKHMRDQAPTDINFTTISGIAGITPQVANITEHGFWLYINGLNSANGYRYWRGYYETVD